MLEYTQIYSNISLSSGSGGLPDKAGDLGGLGGQVPNMTTLIMG